jgi:hypothetical protein
MSSLNKNKNKNFQKENVLINLSVENRDEQTSINNERNISINKI